MNFFIWSMDVGTPLYISSFCWCGYYCYIFWWLVSALLFWWSALPLYIRYIFWVLFCILKGSSITVIIFSMCTFNGWCPFFFSFHFKESVWNTRGEGTWPTMKRKIEGKGSAAYFSFAIIQPGKISLCLHPAYRNCHYRTDLICEVICQTWEVSDLHFFLYVLNFA